MKSLSHSTLDGNSKHCYIDPYQGTLGCLAESVRTLFVLEQTPIGIVDHLQFGNPENEQIFWTFLESVRAIRDFCQLYENSSSRWKSKSL